MSKLICSDKDRNHFNSSNNILALNPDNETSINHMTTNVQSANIYSPSYASKSTIGKISRKNTLNSLNKPLDTK